MCLIALHHAGWCFYHVWSWGRSWVYHMAWAHLTIGSDPHVLFGFQWRKWSGTVSEMKLTFCLCFSSASFSQNRELGDLRDGWTNVASHQKLRRTQATPRERCSPICQQSEVWVSWLLWQTLDSLNCTLSQAIGLWVVRAAGHMLKSILLNEAGELLRAILWAIVTHCHWEHTYTHLARLFGHYHHVRTPGCGLLDGGNDTQCLHTLKFHLDLLA